MSREQFENAVRKTARQVADPKQVERWFNDNLAAVKQRARRRDPVGEATHRTLSVFHQGFGALARGLDRLAEASQPPTRSGGKRGRKAPAKKT
jgi:hypothetical protein